MGYQSERERFIARVLGEGLSLQAAQTLLRCATSINRYAELACSSEAADRDRIPCPRVKGEKIAAKAKIATATRAFEQYPCLCDEYSVNGHQDIPRITLQSWRAEQRAIKAVPQGWAVIKDGDPRGYTLRVIPPSYADFNLDAIGVPAGPSGLRF